MRSSAGAPSTTASTGPGSAARDLTSFEVIAVTANRHEHQPNHLAWSGWVRCKRHGQPLQVAVVGLPANWIPPLARTSAEWLPTELHAASGVRQTGLDAPRAGARTLEVHVVDLEIRVMLKWYTFVTILLAVGFRLREDEAASSCA